MVVGGEFFEIYNQAPPPPTIGFPGACCRYFVVAVTLVLKCH